MKTKLKVLYAVQKNISNNENSSYFDLLCQDFYQELLGNCDSGFTFIMFSL